MIPASATTDPATRSGTALGAGDSGEYTCTPFRSKPQPGFPVRIAAWLALIVLANPLAAQQPFASPMAPQAPVAHGDQSPFRRLDLPGANTIRSGSGAPGRDYWQQRVDYTIRTTLDTASKTVAGTESVSYSNHSPDTLRYLWLQVDQNKYAVGSTGSLLFDAEHAFSPDAQGFGIRQFQVVERRNAPTGKPTAAVKLLSWTHGTMMRVDLSGPLPPRSRTTLEISWQFVLPPVGDRMGRELVDGDWIYEVAQWYPRLAVYDDVRGWNTEQYLGNGEFYLEYGSFDVSITVPAGMLVAATGTLRNPETVLTATERARLARARLSDTTIVIRGASEIGQPGNRPAGTGGMLTWRFTADSVRDFAWATASHFIWDAVRVNRGRTLAMSFYPPSAQPIWSQSSLDAKLAIEQYSQQWMTYPYPYAININGPESGMEYPGIVFCGARNNAEGLYGVTSHEFGHTWFPMVVGSNERLYPWMDEGFNTFINSFDYERQYHKLRNGRGSAVEWATFAATGHDEPIMTPPDRTVALGQIAYNKPATGMLMLRNVISTPERFDPVFREYIRRWAWKHPTPADFFRSMEDGLGEDLSWFWRSWFYTTETLDQAVDSVRTVTDSAGGRSSELFLSNRGPMVMPVDLNLLWDDGSQTRLKLPVEIWYFGNRYTAHLAGPKAVSSVMVDPDSMVVDLDRSNNGWPKN